MESSPVPTRPTAIIEPGRITTYLLIAGAGVLMLVTLATSLRTSLPGKVATATWVVVQTPGLALTAAFAGATAAAGGAWWARRRERASGTTMRSIGYGVGTAAIAGSVIAVLAWASINPAVAGKVALASFVAAVAGGVIGSVRIGGAVLGGLVAVFISMLIGTIGGAVLSWTLTDADPDPHSLPTYLDSVLVAGAIIRGVGVAAGTVVGCHWLTRRRRDTGLAYHLIVGLLGAALQVVAVPIAFLAALPVAHNLVGGNIHPLRALAMQQGVSVLVAIGSGALTATVVYAIRKFGARRPVPTSAVASGAS